MDGVSIAASIVGIASAGVQVSIKLVTLATQISTASDRVSAIGNDISLTSGVLHQLGELMTEKTTDDGVSIFSQGGLESTKASATVCEGIFLQVEREAKKASEQLRDCKQGRFTGGKIKLSKSEKAKWPFLQPSVDTLRADLREAKGTLMLMLQVTTLALSKKLADLNEVTSSSISEQRDFVRAIVALQQQQQQQQRLEVRIRNPDGTTPSQRVTSVTSPTRPGTANRIPSVDVVQYTDNLPISVNASQSQASLTQARTSLYKAPSSRTAMSRGRDMNVKFLNFSPILPGQDRSRDMKISSIPRESFKASNASSHTTDSENTHQMRDGLSAVRSAVRKSTRSNSDRSGDENSAPKFDMELNLFLLKPVVKDYFDKVELSWSIHNTRMQPLAIRKQIANNEQEGIPSVVEMLHNLHAYEQAMVDLEISKYPEGSVLSLRRTKTDIQHRDMTFKAIPGLQFVVQHMIRSYANPKPAFGDFSVPGGQMTSTMPQASVIAPQNIASPMAGCQVCGTLVSPILGQGGHLMCNACGHHFWKQQQSSGQRQQQHQDFLPSFQHTSSCHKQRPSLDVSRRPSTTVRAPPGPVTAVGIQRQQQQLMRMHARATPHQQQQQQMQVNRQAQVAFQQQMQTQQQSLAAPPQQQQQYHQTSQMRASSQVAPQQQREEQQLEQRHHPYSLGAQMSNVPVAGAPNSRIARDSTSASTPQGVFEHRRPSPPSTDHEALSAPSRKRPSGLTLGPQQPGTGSPMRSALQSKSYASQNSYAAQQTQPQSFPQLSPSPTPQQLPAQPYVAHGSYASSYAPQRNPYGCRQPPSPPPQQDDDEEAVSREEAVSGSIRHSIGSTRKRKQEEESIDSSSSESESEEEYEASDESDFDGSEGDNVDVDAIVTQLLEKYTTLFD